MSEPGSSPHLDRSDDVDRTGLPGERAGREGFLLAAALLVATLGLVFTLGWVVYHQIVPESGPTDDDVPTQGPLPDDGSGAGTDG